MKLLIAAADPVITAALAEQAEEAGFACVRAHSAVEAYAVQADALLCDADSLPEVTHARAVYLGGAGLKKPVRRADVLAALALLAESFGVALPGGGAFYPARRVLYGPGGADVTLTEKESGLLACLLAAPARGAERQVLLEKVWGYGQNIDTHTLETHLYRLRQKLKEALGADCILATATGYRVDA